MNYLANAATHQTVQPLLPWLLAGTLDSAEQAMVEQHVQGCAQCQADLAWQRRLRSAAPAPEGAFDADRALAQLLPRLGPQTPRVGVLERWRKAAAANNAWLKWAAAAQLAAIAVLALQLADHADADYRALGAAAHADGNAVVMFRPETTERDMRRILQASGARVVDGPTVTDAYVLALPPAQADAALARMRAERAVTLAQPLAAGARP